MNTDFVKPLMDWYRGNRRDLPWRRTRDPYCIWISEIMLQQTRVEAVKGYYERFIRALPDVRSLAECPEEKLLKLWEGLGYYSRARNLRKAARRIMEEEGGQFPAAALGLLALPGIGPYTAGAIASIAFGEKVPAVDGNVLRVWARLTCSSGNVLSAAFRKRTEAELGEILKTISDDAGTFNQALIELGALICVPNTQPGCGACPVSGFCAARRAGKERELPVRIRTGERRVEDRTVLLVRAGNTAAVRKRPDRGLLSGLYEFPNLPGHVSAEEAVAYVEENGYDALRIIKLPPARHLFSHVEWRMEGYEIRVDSSTDRPGGWILADAEELRKEKPIPAAFSSYTVRLYGKEDTKEVTKKDTWEPEKG